MRLIRYVTYDPATKRIIRSGHCVEGDISLQAGDSESVIEVGVSAHVDDTIHEVVDGAVVNKT